MIVKTFPKLQKKPENTQKLHMRLSHLPIDATYVKKYIVPAEQSDDISELSILVLKSTLTSGAGSVTYFSIQLSSDNIQILHISHSSTVRKLVFQNTVA